MVLPFPRRNLGGEAEPWGRAVENHLQKLESTLGQVGQNTNNQGRSTGSQLAVLSRQAEALQSQTEELAQRGVFQMSGPEVSVTGSATTAPFPTASGSVLLPGRGANRACLVVAASAWSESPATSAACYLEVLSGGQVIGRANMSAGNRLYPAGWGNGQSNLAFSVVIPANGLSLTFRITRIGFTSGSSTWTMQSPTISIYYGDKVE